MKLIYCTECAASLTKTTDTEYVCANGHHYWNEPRPCVAIVLAKGTQILFSKRAREPFKGLYDLPGGFLEYNEEPFAAARREILEETGLNIDEQNMELLRIYPGEYEENVSLLDIVIYVTSWEGEPQAADDSEALEWHDPAFLDDPATSAITHYTGLSALLRSKL